MMLVELALRGISGFPSTARLRLRTGVNVLRTPNLKLRQTVIDAMFHTLYPDGMRASATAALVDHAQDDARIALTLYGRDRATYRLLRQAEFGAMELHRFDPTAKRFVGMSSAGQEIAQYLRVQQQLPDDVTFERLFVLDRAAMPSHGARARFRSQLGEILAMRAAEASWAPSGPGLPAAAPTFSGIRNAWVEDESLVSSPSTSGDSSFAVARDEAQGDRPRGRRSRDASQDEVDARGDGGGGRGRGGGGGAGGDAYGDGDFAVAGVDPAEIKALTAQLEDARAYEDAQARLDHLHRRQAAFETQFKQYREAEASVGSLEQEVEASAALRDIGSPVVARLQRFDELRAKHEEDRARHQSELDDLAAQDRLIPDAHIYRDRYFLGGSLGAALAVALGALLGRPALALLNIPCALVAAGGALRWVSEVETKVRSGIRMRAATERLERLTQQFDLEAGATMKLMEKHGAESTSAFLARIDRAHQVEEALLAARSQLERTADDAAFQAAKKELEQIGPQIEACEAILMSAGPMASVATLEARLARLRGMAASAARDLGRRAVDDVGDAGDFGPAGNFGPADNVVSADNFGPVDNFGSAAEFGDARDFGDDGDDEDGYGSGYGTSGGSSANAKDDAKVSSSAGDGGRGASVWAASSGGSSRGPSGRFGSGSFGPAASGGGGGYGNYAAGGYGSGGFGVAAPTGPLNRSVDLVQSAVDLTQKDEDALAEALRPRLNAYVSAFTDGRWTSASFGARGALQLTAPGDGGSTDYLSLEREDLDLVDTALRLSLLELCVQSVAAPVFVDDPFERLDADKRRLFVRALAELGRATQVIVCTACDDIEGAQVLDSPTAAREV
ncbi:MAG: hypothetical protein H6729_10035 [Deltaproteobacteria bacterium]|nr:hypothetical protein [Deltaproteobacteria bacterium]